MKDIDHNKLVNTIQTIMGSKCQAQKKSHNLGTPEVPRPHYQCIDKFQMHHQLASGVNISRVVCNIKRCVMVSVKHNFRHMICDENNGQCLTWRI
jgi:hypothetical protein